MYRLYAVQVVRYYDGDVVENYSASCYVIGGYCVPDNFTNICESSVQSDTCPYCKCSENRKINSSNLKCSGKQILTLNMFFILHIQLQIHCVILRLAFIFLKFQGKKVTISLK